MLPPYTPEEIAAAVMASLAAAGYRVARLTVTAYDPGREWCLEVVLEDGLRSAARFPFSTPAGITVPAEIADWFLELVSRGAS